MKKYNIKRKICIIAYDIVVQLKRVKWKVIILIRTFSNITAPNFYIKYLSFYVTTNPMRNYNEGKHLICNRHIIDKILRNKLNKGIECLSEKQVTKLLRVIK